MEWRNEIINHRNMSYILYILLRMCLFCLRMPFGHLLLIVFVRFFSVDNGVRIQLQPTDTGRELHFNGQTFYEASTKVNRTVWLCRMRLSSACPARIITDTVTNRIVLHNRRHTHETSPAKPPSQRAGTAVPTEASPFPLSAARLVDVLNTTQTVDADQLLPDGTDRLTEKRTGFAYALLSRTNNLRYFRCERTGCTAALLKCGPKVYALDREVGGHNHGPIDEGR